MPDAIMSPIPITYRGLAADSHLVDGQQFGRSLMGACKVANSACHFFLFNQVTHDSRAYRVRFYVGPSKENGLLQEIFALMSSGQMPTFSPILLKVGEKVIEKLIEAMVKLRVGRKSEAQVAIEAIRDVAMKHTEFAAQVHEGHMRDKERLFDMVESLASENRAPLREMPEPVGRSVREMQMGSDGFTIDEPYAEALRSTEPLSVGDAGEYVVSVEGVFKTNGACRLQLVDGGKPVAGKITDPALGQPGNVYTTALDRGVRLKVQAKPVLKKGRLHRLFVSDARLAE